MTFGNLLPCKNLLVVVFYSFRFLYCCAYSYTHYYRNIVFRDNLESASHLRSLGIGLAAHNDEDDSRNLISGAEPDGVTPVHEY